MIGDTFDWLTDPAHWQSTNFDTGILGQLGAHVLYFSVIALAIALVIALPLGLWIGHTGRRPGWSAPPTPCARCPPSGVLVLLVVIIAPHFYGRDQRGLPDPHRDRAGAAGGATDPVQHLSPGCRTCRPAVRDAAFGMGMTGPQVLGAVELPNALPLIFSGFRSATLQVIATATIASYVTLGGLGRFIYDGLAQQDYPQMISGGLLVAALALVADLLLALASATPSRPASPGEPVAPTGFAPPPPTEGSPTHAPPCVTEELASEPRDTHSRGTATRASAELDRDQRQQQERT